jgi:glycerol-3-phosphate dehydrogenase (NAD(P)+)
MKQVAVIGGGAWGTALANAASLAGCRALLVVRDEKKADQINAAQCNERYLPNIPLQPHVRATSDKSGLTEADIVLMVVPAQVMRSVLDDMRPFLKAGTPLVLCAKGIEQRTGLFLSDVASSLCSASPIALLSGPSFAQDVARGLPTAVTLACFDKHQAKDLSQSLSSSSFRIYHTQDVRGVEIGGALKNVLAIACGIVAGRGLGESARAALMARGFAEIMRFAAAQGAKLETLMGLSGLGDVVLSCTSRQSRNFAFGERLGHGMSLEEAYNGALVEGALTASALFEVSQSQSLDMPVAAEIHHVLNGKCIEEAINALMNRPLKAE